ncbi:MAG UNVERIFIED_CONTAM: hypothetical protein LVR29_09705, partial [Microcystis novacekii LVE1205-3]
VFADITSFSYVLLLNARMAIKPAHWLIPIAVTQTGRVDSSPPVRRNRFIPGECTWLGYDDGDNAYSG